MKYTFSNGMVIEHNDLSEILKLGEVLGQAIDLSKVEGLSDADVPAGYYLSSKEGLVEVKTMNSMHIRNAMVKRTVEYLGTVRAASKKLNDKEFLTMFENLTEDKIIVTLFDELANRPVA